MTKLVIYLVCEPETPELVEAAVEGGADIVELGIPFSDPLAEGPTIQRAAERPSRGMHQGVPPGASPDPARQVRSFDDHAAILGAYG